MQTKDVRELSFAELALPGPLLAALGALGYEKPSPIQQATIPPLLAGRDVIGMAQTGTGKTAAFALPILADIDLKQRSVQALVLCPTRELTLQVAEAFQSYAARLSGFHVLPIYGGQDMRAQLRALKRPVHVIVATPGRLLDHLRRGSLVMDRLKTVVLDEADEMLRMGFIEDVDAILEQTPKQRRVALFSATMPARIRDIAERHLNNPEEVRIKTATATNENIEQHYWLVSGTNKLDALTRILEVEDFDGMLIFVRTRTSTAELADKLNARGFSAAALNGDMNQQLRQRTVEQLRSGELDIVVATDVAARGLDVERITHVMNYDIPHDEEAYVHRIGRTGRAGRTGKAILFVAPRERRMLREIERVTRRKIAPMDLPTRADLIDKRSQSFKDTVVTGLQHEDLSFFESLVDQICQEQARSPVEVASALAFLLQKDRPLQPPKDAPGRATREPRAEAPSSRQDVRSRRDHKDQKPRLKGDRGEQPPRTRPRDANIDTEARPLKDHPDVAMERYRIAVGRRDSVTPREIVGAIANEAGLEGEFIGAIEIYDEFTTVDLPRGMPKEVFQILKKTRVRKRPLNIDRLPGSGKRPRN